MSKNPQAFMQILTLSASVSLLDRARKMRKPGTKGAPTAMAFKKSALTAKKPKKRS
jgi:hypothetical protein